MKPFTTRLICGLGSVLAGMTVQTVLAETQPNPYQAIIERNPFGLKPPPPPPDPTPVVAVTPPGKVLLTGITTMFGSPRALFEVTDTEPGKAATTRKPILHEGDRDGARAPPAPGSSARRCLRLLVPTARTGCRLSVRR
jgi:hypothetical protein